MSDIEFIDGISVKDPRPKAPDFVICSGGIRRLALIEYLQQQDGDYVNFQIKRSKKGGLYVQRDNWKPASAQKPDVAPGGPSANPEAGAGNPANNTGGEFDDDIPFTPYQKGWIA
jgi:hypothetical protein